MKTLKISLCLILLSNLAMAQTDESLDASFSTATGKQLTDEQYKAATEFVHQGIKDEAIKEGCAQKGLQDCNPSPQDEGVIFKGGLGAMLENNISTLYAMFFGGTSFLGGGGGPKVKTNKVGDDGKKETKTDFCMYGAIGGEVIAKGMQMTGQSSAQQSTANLNDPQLQALANLKETHKTRKKTATLQSGIYTAVTACYAARAAFGGVAMDASYIAKMTAAGAIAALYKAKANKHSSAMKKVQAVIDSLPKAGDCNPYTGTACFCKESTSEKLYPAQYQEMCLGTAGTEEAIIAVSGCAANTNGTVTYDAECKCKETNSCYSTKVSTYNPKFSLGKNFANMANTGFDLTQGGSFDEAAINKFTGDANALYNRVKSKIDTSKLPKTNLTDAQKKVAADLSTLMPPAAAAMAAANQPAEPAEGGLMNDGTSAALAKLPDNLKKQLNAEVSGGYSRNGGGGNSGAGSEDVAFVMPKFGAEAESSNGTEVVSFAQKAIENAEVSNRPETPIFDIISNRYRTSGWNRVEIKE